jgi:hypothetical protein
MFWHKHNWKTVAIDTSNGWSRINRWGQSDERVSFTHIIKFKECSCGARIIEAVDPSEDGREFAMNDHSAIALQKAIWEDSGKITGYSDAGITWVDPKYAPLQGFDAHVTAMKADPVIKQMLDDHSMVKDAVEQLEVVIKLHENIGVK